MDPIVIGRKIKQSYPQYANVDDTTLGNKYLQKYGGAISSVQSGQINIKDIPEKQRVGVGLGLEAVGYKPQEASSEVGKITAKDLSLAKTGIDRIKQVKDLYEKDPSVLSKQLIPGQFASRKFDSAVYDATDALLRLRTGAQANPSEIRGYMQKIAPYFGDTPDVVEQKLNNLQADLAEYGGENLKSKVQPIKLSLSQQQTQQQGVQGPLGVLLGLGKTVSGLIPETMAIPKRAMELTEEQMARPKPKNVGEIVGRSTGDFLKMLGIAAPAAGELALYKGGGAVGKGIVKGIGKVARPMKTVGKAREIAAEKVTEKIPGDVIVSNVKQWAEKVPAAYLKEAQKFATDVASKFGGKQFTVKELLGEKAASYDIGYLLTRAARGAEAAGERQVASAIKQVVKKYPEVAKYDKLFELLYGGKKFARKVISPFALGGFGAGAGGAFLYNILSGGERR